jgi:hypothetical protein
MVSCIFEPLEKGTGARKLVRVPCHIIEGRLQHSPELLGLAGRIHGVPFLIGNLTTPKRAMRQQTLIIE